MTGVLLFMKNEEIQKGEDEMNACAMKPKLPYVTKNTLTRTPASEDNKKITVDLRRTTVNNNQKSRQSCFNG